MILVSLIILIPFIAWCFYLYNRAKKKAAITVAKLENSIEAQLSEYKLLDLVDKREWVGDLAYEEISLTKLEKIFFWSFIIKTNFKFTVSEKNKTIYTKFWYPYEKEPVWMGSAKNA